MEGSIDTTMQPACFCMLVVGLALLASLAMLYLGLAVWS